MSKNKSATEQSEQKTTPANSSTPVVTTASTEDKKKRERVPYSHPVRPSWMPDNGTELVSIETTASNTPGQNNGAKFIYKGELLTKTGLAAFVQHNADYALDLINSNITYRKLNQYARVEGIGTHKEFRPDWNYKPGDGKSAKAAKERAEKEAQLAKDRAAYVEQLTDLGVPEELHEEKWQAWLVKTGRIMASL